MNTVIAEHAVESGARMVLVRGDITVEPVDAIVNAANSHLQHGGGVAGHIAAAGGPSIQRESNTIGYVPTGDAAVTGAGALPCRYVIHAVGPVWGTGDEDDKLRRAVANSLKRAEELGLESISLPAISSGIFGFPKDLCADILLDTAEAYLDDHPQSSLREIRFCLYDAPTVEAFENAWADRFSAA